MEFNASNRLIEKINKEEKTTLYMFLLGIFMFSLFGIGMYLRDENKIFFFDIIILSIMAILYIYITIIRKIQVINKTVIGISITNQKIKLLTCNFKLFS